MERKGIEDSIVRAANPTDWRWIIRLDEKRTKVGSAFSRLYADLRPNADLKPM